MAQLVQDVAEAGAYVPTAQALVTADRPDEEQKLPTGHAVMVLWPVVAQSDPAPQLTHEPKPAPG